METKLTRRQFGLGILGAIGAFLLARIFGGLDASRSAATAQMRARFWRRADELAG